MLIDQEYPLGGRFDDRINENQVDKFKHLPLIAATKLKGMPSMLLRRWEHMRFDKKIRAVNLPSRPLIILGFWRSGTSYLQLLLSRDPHFFWHNKFQLFFPDIFLSTGSLQEGVILQYLSQFPIFHEAHKKVSVNLKDLSYPGEVELGLTLAAIPHCFNWGFIFPKEWRYYFEKYLLMETITEKEKREWKESFLYYCKKIYLQNSGNQLLIKNPGDQARIQELLEMFPEARFVFLHRNPYDLFYSNVKLWKTFIDHVALQPFSEREMKEVILETYVRVHDRYQEQVALIPQKNLVEISYDVLMNDPLSTLEHIYEALGMNHFDQVQTHFNALLSEEPAKKNQGYSYQEEDVKLINEHWEFAFDELGYQKKEMGSKKDMSLPAKG